MARTQWRGGLSQPGHALSDHPVLSSELLWGFNLAFCSFHPQSKWHILIPAESPPFYSHFNAISVQGWAPPEGSLPPPGVLAFRWTFSNSFKCTVVSSSYF